MFNLVEYLAQNPVWIGLLGGGLIIPPVLGIAFIHNKYKKMEKKTDVVI
jgi:hypothetical protein